MKREDFQEYVRLMLRAWSCARDARSIADYETPEYHSASRVHDAAQDEILRLTGLMPDEVDHYNPKPRTR